MRPPDHAEPWDLPWERIYGLPPEPDLAGALVLLNQARGLVPRRLSAVLAAMNVAETGLQEALAQLVLLEEEEPR